MAKLANSGLIAALDYSLRRVLTSTNNNDSNRPFHWISNISNSYSSPSRLSSNRYRQCRYGSGGAGRAATTTDCYGYEDPLFRRASFEMRAVAGSPVERALK
jgi:hypothetical protein